MALMSKTPAPMLEEQRVTTLRNEIDAFIDKRVQDPQAWAQRTAACGGCPGVRFAEHLNGQKLMPLRRVHSHHSI